jgi:hypothetical protein
LPNKSKIIFALGGISIPLMVSRRLSMLAAEITQPGIVRSNTL